MDIVTVMLIAVGLAMDAFAVSITSGALLKEARVHKAFKMAFAFGFFQMLMPLAGWLAGDRARALIGGFDHYLAFALLAFVGGRMIYGSLKKGEGRDTADPFGAGALLVLAFATSIDAFSVGMSFAFLSVSIIAPVAIIGLVTFLMSFAGIFLGERFGHLFERKIEVVGGLLLIGIGVKILIEHLT